MRRLWDRDRNLRPRRAVRGLLGAVPDVQPGGRPQRQSGAVRPALPPALADGRAGGVSALPQGPVRAGRPGRAARRRGEQPQDRGTDEARGVRGRHRGGLSPGAGRAGSRAGQPRRRERSRRAQADVQPRRLHPGLRAGGEGRGTHVSRAAQPPGRAGGQLPQKRRDPAGRGRGNRRRAGPAPGGDRGCARKAVRPRRGAGKMRPGQARGSTVPAGQRSPDARGAGEL